MLQVLRPVSHEHRGVAMEEKSLVASVGYLRLMERKETEKNKTFKRPVGI